MSEDNKNNKKVTGILLPIAIVGFVLSCLAGISSIVNFTFNYDPELSILLAIFTGMLLICSAIFYVGDYITKILKKEV